MNRVLRSGALWSLALAGMLSLAGCGGHTAHEAGQAEQAPVRAHATILRPTSVPVEVESPGTVTSARTVQVASRLTGYVDRLDVDLGDRVHQGQLLLTIDDRDVEARVQQARAGVAAAEATLADARFNYQRYRDLYHQGAASRQEFERIKRNYDTATAQLKAARAGLQAAEAQRAYARVRAPVSGVVTRRNVDAGDLAVPGKALVTLQQPGNLQVRTEVTRAAFRALKPGSRVWVVADGASIRARVIHLGPAATPATQTYPVKLALPADAELASGSFVRVLVAVGHRQALLVPRTAVLHRAGIPAVVTVGKDGRAHLRLVRLGETRHGRVEITAGLTAGTRFLAAPTQEIENGTPIESQGTADGQ